MRRALVALCVALQGPALGAQAPRTMVVRVEPADIVWIEGGDARIGGDALSTDHAITLCRREIRRHAELLREPPDAPAFALRARLMLTVCLDQVIPPEGCSPMLFAREAGAREVWLSPYGIDRTEVTVAAYARCVRASVCAPPLDPPGTPLTGAPSQPVTGVRWADADTYCRWIGARLPTDAEWEHAARGREGRHFPWGFQWDPGRANHGAMAPGCRDDDDGFAMAAPVGSFPSGASPEGALDLAGNVQEWVYDRAGPMPWSASAPRAVNPRGPSVGGERIVRGGAYSHPSWALRGAWRSALGGGERRRDTGFRCAWDPHHRGR